MPVCTAAICHFFPLIFYQHIHNLIGQADKQIRFIYFRVKFPQIDFFHGEIAISSWYKIIPRVLWSGKPFDYGFALLNYEIYPDYAADGYMPSFGLAYTYADFGMVFILISGFFVGFWRKFFYDMFYNSNRNGISYVAYLLPIDVVLMVLLFICHWIGNIKFVFKLNKQSCDS